jgi:predicted dehydrogenase
MPLKLNVGIIGLGMFGLEHVRAFGQNPRTQVRWISTRTQRALVETAARNNIPNATPDYRKMLADPHLHAVAVCTPPDTHIEIGLDVLRAGKHLLMEKPLALTAHEALRLVEAARHHAVVLSGCTARYSRLNPKFHLVHRMIREGKLGEVYFIHHRHVAQRNRPGIEYNPPAKWFLDRGKAGGGTLMDWGGYDLAFHLGLVGDPAIENATAFCVQGLDRIDPGSNVFDVEEHGGAMMHFKDGLRYFWERASNAHCDIPNQTVIYGNKGGIRLSYCPWDSPDVEFFYTADEGRGAPQREIISVPPTWQPGSGDMDAVAEAFAAAIIDKAHLPVPPEREVENLKIVEKVYEAAGWGRK